MILNKEDIESLKNENKDFSTEKLHVNFSKLIGSYDIQKKMLVIDWFLRTGVKHKQWTGRWTREGISKRLFGYSANESEHEFSMPYKTIYWNFVLDAILARAIFQEPNKPVKEWRIEERILPNKSRVFNVKEYQKTYIFHPIEDIFSFNNRLLKKKYAHPDYKNRLKPKIIGISIFTLGRGWTVRCLFSFECYDYENGWDFYFNQKKTETILEFFENTSKKLKEYTLDIL